MFGLGWGEMVVIGIVALIAIGPKELPTVLRTIGHWMGKIRRMANEFQGQFHEALREAELTDLKKHADDLATDLNKFESDTTRDMEKSFDMPDPLKEPEPALAAPSTEPVTDGEKLPASAIPTSAIPSSDIASSALPPIDVPMPELPPPVTEKDFLPAEPAPQEMLKVAPQKQAGGGA